MRPDDARAAVGRYPLLDALRERRSRRFGLGMAMPAGPLAHRSRHPGLPLSEDEAALLAFAACGITGPALADHDRYYRPEALSATQREHLVRWHGGPAGSAAPAGS